MENLERLQKIISTAGIASRRTAEEWIRAGRVTLNGKVVTELGTRADANRDHIKVNGRLIRPAARRVYVLLNKPKGVLTTVSDPEGRMRVTDLVKVKGKLYPVGRLDYNTEGLILLTNDGEFARIVSAAGDALPKVYLAKVRGIPDENSLNRLRAGCRLPGGTRLAPAGIRLLRPENNAWLEVTLTQGMNRQIHRMFESIGHPVAKLRRIRIGFLSAGDLPVGAWRFLAPREVARMLRIARSDD